MIWVGGCARAYVCACLCIPACLRLRPCLYTHSLTHSQTRIHTQVGPFKERDFVTRVHYRTLADGTLVVANRAERSSKAPVSERYLRMEIMVGGNIIRPIDSDPTRTNFTVCDRCMCVCVCVCVCVCLCVCVCVCVCMCVCECMCVCVCECMCVCVCLFSCAWARANTHTMVSMQVVILQSSNPGCPPTANIQTHIQVITHVNPGGVADTRLGAMILNAAAASGVCVCVCVCVCTSLSLPPSLSLSPSLFLSLSVSVSVSVSLSLSLTLHLRIHVLIPIFMLRTQVLSSSFKGFASVSPKTTSTRLSGLR